MPDSVNLSANLPARRYFRLGEEDRVKKEFDGNLPHEAVKQNGRELNVSISKEIWVGELTHSSNRGEWLVKSWADGELTEKSKRQGLGEIVARSIISQILGTEAELTIPEAFVYEMPGDIHLVTKFLGDSTSIADEPALLRLLTPEVKSKIALCIIAAGINEFPMSSVLINENTGKPSLIDFESITLPFDEEKVLPSFPANTQLTLSHLRAMVPKDDPVTSEGDFQDKFVTETERCLLRWKERINTDDSLKENLMNIICTETGLPRDDDSGKLSAKSIVENLIFIANNIDNLHLPNSYKAFNKTDALKRVGGNINLLSELTSVLETETNNKIFPGMDEAIKDGNSKVLQRLGHTLKGSLCIFAAKELEELAEKLERMGKENDLANAKQVLDKLKAKFPILISALKRSF